MARWCAADKELGRRWPGCQSTAMLAEVGWGEPSRHHSRFL